MFIFCWTDKINHPEACYAKVCRSDIDCMQLQKKKKNNNNLSKRNNNNNKKNPATNDDQDERVCCYNGSVY